MSLGEVQALAFDTFGTVVDWRGSILAELRALGAAKGLAVDWGAFLADWKAGYRAGMDRVNAGEWPWTNVDVIYRRRLDEVLAAHRVTGLADAEVAHLNEVWCRLQPWPDAVPGLTRLKRRYVVTPLSNGNFAWLVRLARFAGLPWDCVITAENARWYKPRPEVYRTAVALLGLAPDQLMLVAAHNYDLRAARAVGLRTAFVPRPTEHGPSQTTDLTPEADWEVVAGDFRDLAGRLGA